MFAMLSKTPDAISLAKQFEEVKRQSPSQYDLIHKFRTLTPSKKEMDEFKQKSAHKLKSTLNTSKSPSPRLLCKQGVQTVVDVYKRDTRT